MTELYCIFISALILVMTAEAYLRGRCRHDEYRAIDGEYFKYDGYIVFYTQYQCKKCGHIKLERSFYE